MSRPAPSRIADHLPNLISLMRAVLAVPICLLLLQGSQPVIWPALALFTAAAASDLVDGALARRLRATSMLGSHLDPLADKILVGVPLAVLPFAQDPLFASATVMALVVFVAAEGSMTLRRIAHLRRGEALPASPRAKWKTAAEYLGVAAAIAGLGPVPLGGALQIAGSAIVLLASGYASRMDSIAGAKGRVSSSSLPVSSPAHAGDPEAAALRRLGGPDEPGHDELEIVRVDMEARRSKRRPHRL